MTTTTVSLPDELAPALRTRVLDLLSEVPVVPEVPSLDRASRRAPAVNRCAVCYRSGVLGGHHAAPDRVVWVHRSCHRRLHRRGRGRRHHHGGQRGVGRLSGLPARPAVPGARWNGQPTHVRRREDGSDG